MKVPPGPLKIDWFSRAYTAPGLLGLTHALGRKEDLPGPGGHWDRDLMADMGELMAQRVRVVVSLLEPFEYHMIGQSPAGTRQIAARHKIVYAHVPVADRHLPKDLELWRATAKAVATSLQVGAKVVVHCRAGHGRAGMFAASVLIELGMDAIAAIRRVRATRKDTLKRAQQVDFVLGYVSSNDALEISD